MNIGAIILLTVHFVFSIICGWAVCRTYDKKSSYFFKGFLLTLFFGFNRSIIFFEKYDTG